MRKIICKYNLTSFYIITLVFSFLLLPLHFVFQSVGKYSISFTQLSLALAVLLISFILKNKTNIQDIKNHLVFDKSVLKWAIPAIVIPSVCILISSFILTYLKIDYVSWTGDLLFYILNIIAILIGCAAEEIGWRGFLLPKLQKKYNPFTSSLIVGGLWGVWHLNFTGGILGFILYTVTVIEMSVLMTWLYNKSDRNLILMIIWHFMFNLTSHIFLWDRFNLNLFITQSLVFGLVCVFILVSDKNTFFKSSVEEQ